VDDKQEIVNFCDEYLLRPNGYVPIVASNGHQGVEIALTENPDLMILDFKLPGLSGLQVLQALRERQVHIPVIFITAYGSEEEIVTAFRLGVKDYFRKPFNPKEMLDAIERILIDTKEQKQQTRQQRELGKYVKELGTLYGSSVERVLNRIVDAAVAVTDGEEGYLLLVDEQTNELYIRSALNLGESFARGFRLRVGDGIAGRVVRDGQSVRYNNIDDTNRFKVKTGYLVKSLINVPLRIQDKTIGVLGVDNQRSARNFTRTDQELLTVLAEHAATAITNASLYEGTHQNLARRVQELSMMQEVARDLSAVVDMRRIASTLLHHAIRITSAEAGLVGLQIEDKVEWTSDGYITAALEDKSWAPDWKSGAIGQATRTGQSTLHDDLSRNFDSVHTLPQTHSQLVIPILLGEQVVGIIDLESTQVNAFSNDDQRFLLALSDRAAVAIQNTRLFDRVIEEQSKTKLVLQSIADGVYTVDCDLRILTFNPAAEQIMGWREAEVQGELCSKTFCNVGSDGQSHQTQLIQQALERGQPTSSDSDAPAILNRDGREIFVSSSVAPISDRKGQVVGAVVAFRDVSAERELDRLKSDFVSMVSHELRSPLANLSAAIELMYSALHNQDVMQQALDIANTNKQRLVRLVSDILNISQIEAGQMKAQREPVTVLPIIQRLVRTAQASTNKHQILFRKPDSVPFVMADSNKLEIVLNNFLENAIRYSPDGGRILVKIVGPVDDQLVISVIDEGIGISKEHAEKIFDRFYRVDGSDGRKVYGHGLGLYISKHLIELQNGRIWVQSKEGLGSCFSFSLPIVQEYEIV
jgi:PAS domain S-box-containing protein